MSVSASLSFSDKFHAFMGRKTVDGVMAAFHTAIADLEQVKQSRQAEMDHHNRIADEAVRAINVAMDEADRAERLIGRLTEIVK